MIEWISALELEKRLEDSNGEFRPRESCIVTSQVWLDTLLKGKNWKRFHLQNLTFTEMVGIHGGSFSEAFYIDDCNFIRGLDFNRISAKRFSITNTRTEFLHTGFDCQFDKASIRAVRGSVHAATSSILSLAGWPSKRHSKCLKRNPFNLISEMIGLAVTFKQNRCLPTTQWRH